MIGYTIDNIQTKLTNGGYETKLPYPTKPEGYHIENYVYDEEKSVRWNREHRLELENKYKEELSAYKESCSNKIDEFKNDLKKVILNTHNFNEDIAEYIIQKTYSKDIDYMSDILWEAIDLADFAEKIREF